MNFIETTLPGGFIIQLEKREDDRGYFARAWCQQEFEEHGLNSRVVQYNVGFSSHKGTVRGMHFQEAPHAEVKLLRCTRGAVYDVMVDLRPQSPTCCQWMGVELTPDNGKMLYVPEGFAHGYQTLIDDTEIHYQTSQVYAPSAAKGVRYDDPAFGVDWPMAATNISDQDRNWPDFQVKSDIVEGAQ